MEIMGLAIIVVLMILGLLFAVRFILFKSPSTYRSEYTTTQLTANMLNTMLNVNTECNQVSVSELLQDASRDSPNIVCGIQNSQDFANETISYLLNKTLDPLRRDYYFRASVPDKVVVEAGTSLTNRERERKTHFLQTDVGIMTISLDVYG